MASQYRIIIQNLSGQTTDFYAFQKQAAFVNSGDPSDILASSLAYGPLAPHDSSGAQLEFGFDTQNYVGVKSTVALPSTAAFNARIIPASVNDATSQTYAAQPIELTPSTPGETVNNFSVITISPLGLSPPHYESGLDAGYFGVEVPPYSPASSEFYCGCASFNQDGSIILSSFIAPRPNSQVECAPVATYYVKVGNFPVGQVVSYNTAQSAECNFTGGGQVITVTYNSDGTFTTEIN